MTNTELRQIRLALGYTQQQLSEQLQVSVGSIARYEMPKNEGRFPVPKWMERELNRLLTDCQRGLTLADRPPLTNRRPNHESL